MKDSYLCFQENIENLRKYIFNNKNTKNFINTVQKSSSKHQQEALWLDFNNINTRVFEYNCYIISLYGYFEQYIESIIAEYIDDISALHLSYQELPLEILKNNVKKNSELLSSLDLPKYKDVDSKNIIKTLNENINENLTKINTEAFCHHSSNFRINTINDIFKYVGVSDLGKKITEYSPLNDLLNSDIPNHKNLNLSQTFSIIDELAERRNHIAHGVMPDNILDTDEILNFAKFLDKFSESLNKHLENLILKRVVDTTISTPKIKCINLDVITVHNKEILCIKSNNNALDKNSEIIVVSDREPFHKLVNIINIQVNRTDVIRVNKEESLDVALQLSSKVKNTNYFYLIERN